MATLHVVVYKHAVTGDDMIQVLVNGFCEMERSVKDWPVIVAFLESLKEMCILDEDRYQLKLKRVKQIAEI